MENISATRELINYMIEQIENQNKDSIEVGTPAKGGACKIYLDFSKPDECRAKIDNALELRKYATNKMLENEVKE